MRDERRVLVVGAGLAGGRTCVALRAAGFSGSITLVGAEPHTPYDRPPLSKAVLATGEDTTLDYDFEALEVTLRLGERAQALDRTQQVVRTDMAEHPYDVLVLATGAEPVRLPGDGRQICLRTREDAAEVHAALVPGARVVLVGAGWIGAEVATAALAHGCSVACLEYAPVPLAAQLGPDVAPRLVPWWEGVDLRTGVRVAEMTAAGVRLGDDTVVPADLVVTGLGVRPATGWLATSGLELDGGVAVDSDRRTSDPNVYAVGDVAARWSPRYAARVTGGHWDEAVNGPGAAAAAIVGAPKGVDDIPYFWSDQFGRKIQYVGQHAPSDRAVFRQHATDPAKWGVAWLSSDDRLTAHLSVGFPKAVVRARAAIEDRRQVDLRALGSLDAVPGLSPRIMLAKFLMRN
jgi:NADPH-dependent 2,4-dienoyl-CoA reductase/sulfur reductase-like enzyme